MASTTGGGTQLPPIKENQNKEDVERGGHNLVTKETHLNNDPTHLQASESTRIPPAAASVTCKPIAADRPKINLTSHHINAQIQYMKDHALIGKFIGF